jgi:hypothetical protein
VTLELPRPTLGLGAIAAPSPHNVVAYNRRSVSGRLVIDVVPDDESAARTVLVRVRLDGRPLTTGDNLTMLVVVSGSAEVVNVQATRASVMLSTRPRASGGWVFCTAVVGGTRVNAAFATCGHWESVAGQHGDDTDRRWAKEFNLTGPSWKTG